MFVEGSKRMEWAIMSNHSLIYSTSSSTQVVTERSMRTKLQLSQGTRILSELPFFMDINNTYLIREYCGLCPNALR